ncbi:hypothetical protein N8856_02990 [Candidatus Pelagibacter ubique]|nr:hypothetical protein [Candidatus Pelagibacter ubique]MDC1054820.1 hypothetical protein [Candidatus Pelagibacter ubique]
MAVKQNYKNVLKYLEENNIDPKKALEIIVKADPYNPNNIQARWKMKRFQLYLWARLDEHENGWLLKKTETVRNVVHSKKFRETAEVFDPQFYWKVGNFWLKQSLKSTLSKLPKGTRLTPNNSPKQFKRINAEEFFKLQFKRLNHLITDPRQQEYFKSKYFTFEGKTENIPQNLIDKIK